EDRAVTRGTGPLPRVTRSPARRSRSSRAQHERGPTASRRYGSRLRPPVSQTREGTWPSGLARAAHGSTATYKTGRPSPEPLCGRLDFQRVNGAAVRVGPAGEEIAERVHLQNVVPP